MRLACLICTLLIVSTMCLPAAGQFVVYETYNSLTQQGEFTAENNSGLDIAAFMVENTHGSPFFAFTDGDADSLGWDAFVVTETEWSDASDFSDLAFVDSWTGPELLDWQTELGFSPGSEAFVYYAFDLGEASQPIGDGETAGGFLFAAPLPESRFAAFDDGGSLVSTGETVPEPASLWLVLLGLAALLPRAAARR